MRRGKCFAKQSPSTGISGWHKTQYSIFKPTNFVFKFVCQQSACLDFTFHVLFVNCVIPRLKTSEYGSPSPVYTEFTFSNALSLALFLVSCLQEKVEWGKWTTWKVKVSGRESEKTADADRKCETREYV